MKYFPVLLLVVTVLCFILRNEVLGLAEEETENGYTPIEAYLDELETVYHLDFNQSKARLIKNDVKFFLYTKDTNGQEFSEYNIQEFPTEYKNYIFVAHGWTGNHKLQWISDITKVILSNEDNAVVKVNWCRPASNVVYSIVAFNSKNVGHRIGDFIIKLYRKKNINLNSVTLIGHSLGAHVVGFAGKRIYQKLRRKVGKIIGSDPAGPHFNFQYANNRLSKNDAKCVVVIHTDMMKFGYRKSLGALDFFPNGGYAPQPGCCFITHVEISNIVGCSHTLATVYLIEALKKQKPFETSRDGKNKFLRAVNGDCSMGRNNYYFTVNKNPPYL